MDAPDRWEDLGNRLQDVLVLLSRAPAGKHDLRPEDETWESLARFFFADEFLNRPSVDRAVKQLARGVSPDISPAVRYYLSIRIQCALDFTGMIFPPLADASPVGEITSDWSDQKTIEWLLIDLWNRRYDHWLKLNAIGVRGPFPFYGLEKAPDGI